MPKSYDMSDTNGAKVNGGFENGIDLEEGQVATLKLEKVDVDVAEGEGKAKEEPAEAKKAATFGELYSFATPLDKLLIFLSVLTAGAHGASWPLMFLMFGSMTNAFVTYDPSTPGSGDTLQDSMTDLSLNYVYIGVGVALASYVHIAFLQIAGERQTLKLRKAFLRSLLREEVAWFDKQASGELTTRLADDLERVKEGIGDKLGLALQFISQFVAGFVLGFAKGWDMTLVIMSMTPFLVVGAALLGKIMSSYAAQEQAKYAKAGGVAEEVLSCIRTVISFNGQNREVERYSVALEESKKLGIRKSVFQGLSVGTTLMIMFCAYGIAFWYGSMRVDVWQQCCVALLYPGHDMASLNQSTLPLVWLECQVTGCDEGMDPGRVFSVFFSVLAGSFALGSAAPHITALLTAKGAAGTIIGVIKDKPTIDSSSSSGQTPPKVTGRIQLKDVTFTYASRKDVKVLKGCNLEIKPGQTVALVGASGCGKSTIVNLIQRFYDPTEGQVLLDGTDVKELNIRWLREHIGIVSQEPVLFGMSIAANIELGKPGISQEDIVSAARMANAHDFISSLPDGYDTMVGERGAQLSGGQKQRVAIARALVRDPRILLLDEATSALDTENEKLVQVALDKARSGRTTIVVAHRLSTIQKADLIYVMDGGMVVEEGTHEGLMERRGAYYSLVTLQTITEQEDTADHGTEKDEDPSTPAPLGQAGPLTKQASRQLSTQASVVSNGGGEKAKSLFKSKKEPEVSEEDKNIDRPGFGRMFKANASEWQFILPGCFNAIINGLIFPLFAIFMSGIIKAFSKSGDDLLDEGLFWSMMFVMIGGVSFVVNVLQTVCFGISGERLTKRLRLQSFQNMVRQDVAYFDDQKHSTGALTTRLATDASNVRNATGFRLALILQSIASMVAGMFIAFMFGWKLALAVIGGVPFVALSGAINAKMLKGNQMRDSDLLEEAGKTASEAVENIRTVQSLTREKYFYDRYSEQLVKPHQESMKQAHIYGLSLGFSQSVIFFLYAGAFRFGAYLVAEGEMDPDMVFRVFFAIAFTGMSVGQASSFLPEYSKAQLSAGHIFTIIDLIPKIDVYSQKGVKKAVEAGEVELRDVHFSYPSRPDVEVLKGVSIKVMPGQTAALVGMSGCGKSTIVSLIQRYYDPSDGTVVVENVDIRDYQLQSVRSSMAVVSQEPILFDASIRDNIIYGLDTEVPMADVIDAARQANAHDFISALPDGYNTSVGEKGTQLSGGQKQRVAIARALVRNPKILLLDEATSALDSESERMVQVALDKAREGRTCIVIAHRLSTIQNADVIYAMDGGRVVESGTHMELVARRGAYAALVHGQQFTRTQD